MLSVFFLTIGAVMAIMCVFCAIVDYELGIKFFTMVSLSFMVGWGVAFYNELHPPEKITLDNQNKTQHTEEYSCSCPRE